MYFPGLVLFLYVLVSSQSVDCHLHVVSSAVPGNSSYDLISRVQDDIVSQQPDLVVMMVGTNDMVNSSKLSSYQEFSNNIEQLIKHFQKNNIDLVLVSPPPVDSIYLFKRHNPKLFDDSPNVRLRKARDILASKSKDHGIVFIDVFNLFKQQQIPDHNKDSVIRNYSNSGVHDGVHPTSIGYKMIADQICKVLLSKRKNLKRNTRIICFGDSITWGFGVIGEGTAAGETYPAFLKNRLCANQILGR